MTERAVIQVDLPDGSVFEAQAPTAEQWERYVDKLARGDEQPGRRELVQTCAISCSPEEAVAIVRRYPGFVRPVSEALSNLAAGDAEAIFADGAVHVLGVAIAVPELDAWEHLQNNIKTSAASAMRKALISWADNREEAALVFSRCPAAVQIALSEISRQVGSQVTITVKKG